LEESSCARTTIRIGDVELVASALVETALTIGVAPDKLAFKLLIKRPAVVDALTDDAKPEDHLDERGETRVQTRGFWTVFCAFFRNAFGLLWRIVAWIFRCICAICSALGRLARGAFNLVYFSVETVLRSVVFGEGGNARVVALVVASCVTAVVIAASIIGFWLANG
jgi:hypothetical protein